MWVNMKEDVRSTIFGYSDYGVLPQHWVELNPNYIYSELPTSRLYEDEKSDLIMV
jgi:hypothetical protein